MARESPDHLGRIAQGGAGMTREDDVNTMRLLFNALIGDLCNQCRHNDAEEMEGIRDRLIKRLLEKNKVYDWIPVSERLPEPYQICLFTVEKTRWENEPIEYIVIVKAYGGEQNFTAWMPLPEPYKAESEDKE